MNPASNLPNAGTRARNGKFKRIAWFIAVPLLLLAVLTGFVSYQVINTLMHHPRDKNVSYELDPVKTPYETVEFNRLNSNVVLKGYFFPASGLSGTAGNRTIIAVHGYTSNRLIKGRTRNLVEHLVPRGYNVLAFDLSGQGESEGELITLGFNEKNDLLGAVSYLKSREHAGEHIGVIGFSMGAVTSLIAASESDDIEAVIADSPFRNAGLFLREGLPYFAGVPSFPFGWTSVWAAQWVYKVDLNAVSPMDAVQKMKIKPVMLIHGTGDQQIHYQNTEMIFESLKGNPHAEVWYPANTEHIDAINHYPKEFFQRTDRFWDAYLGKE